MHDVFKASGVLAKHTESMRAISEAAILPHQQLNTAAQVDQGAATFPVEIVAWFACLLIFLWLASLYLEECNARGQSIVELPRFEQLLVAYSLYDISTRAQRWIANLLRRVFPDSPPN
jgi:hypothetical protein